MKKKILALLSFCIMTTICFGQVQWYRATSFASKTVNSSYWSAWEASNVQMMFNLTTDQIVIYSPVTQRYNVIRQVEAPYDNSGTQVRFLVTNSGGYYGYVRLRIENNGNSQVYVDFTDGSIVYNVRRIYVD